MTDTILFNEAVLKKKKKKKIYIMITSGRSQHLAPHLPVPRHDQTFQL